MNPLVTNKNERHHRQQNHPKDPNMPESPIRRQTKRVNKTISRNAKRSQQKGISSPQW